MNSKYKNNINNNSQKRISKNEQRYEVIDSKV